MRPLQYTVDVLQLQRLNELVLKARASEVFIRRVSRSVAGQLLKACCGRGHNLIKARAVLARLHHYSFRGLHLLTAARVPR